MLHWQDLFSSALNLLQECELDWNTAEVRVRANIQIRLEDYLILALIKFCLEFPRSTRQLLSLIRSRWTLRPNDWRYLDIKECPTKVPWSLIRLSTRLSSCASEIIFHDFANHITRKRKTSPTFSLRCNGKVDCLLSSLSFVATSTFLSGRMREFYLGDCDKSYENGWNDLRFINCRSVLKWYYDENF